MGVIFRQMFVSLCLCLLSEFSRGLSPGSYWNQAQNTELEMVQEIKGKKNN